MRSIELFAGAGGLAMGIANAGFHHDAVIERDHDACETVRSNQTQGIQPITQWPLFEMDVKKFDFSTISGEIDLIAGGPPCQPFSLGGKHRGYLDERNMFPEAIRSIRMIRPRAVLFENVRGLLRRSFATYFEYIKLQITYPDVIRKADETWMEHLSRLEKYQTRGSHDGLTYNVVFRLINAADYGVPQRRERVFIVAFRSDLGIEWSFPDPTHSHDALLASQWVTGEYWERHGVPKSGQPERSANVRSHVLDMKYQYVLPLGQPWRTVRDAISDLPDPEISPDAMRISNHRFIPGARSYPGHMGSPLDEPAKTLKAGDHGVPGGENMLARHDGRVRYFTVRESARLQTFPDAYTFPGSWTESMRQLGNAVPVALGHIMASGIKTRLEQANHDR